MSSKNKDQEIEAEVSSHIVMAGASIGRSLYYINLAETKAKEHSQYKEKYEVSLKLLKSLYQVSSLVK